MTRRWYEIMPAPYNVEQPVALFTIPSDWKLVEGMTKDKKYRVLTAVSPKEDDLVGLQVVDSELSGFLEQRDLFRGYDIPLPELIWHGPISLLPQEFLLDETVRPMLFIRNEMWRKPLDLHAVFRRSETKC